jgi:hypothetical protein
VDCSRNIEEKDLEKAPHWNFAVLKTGKRRINQSSDSLGWEARLNDGRGIFWRSLSSKEGNLFGYKRNPTSQILALSHNSCGLVFLVVLVLVSFSRIGKSFFPSFFLVFFS